MVLGLGAAWLRYTTQPGMSSKLVIRRHTAPTERGLPRVTDVQTLWPALTAEYRLTA